MPMKKINILLLFLLLSFSMFAQDRISVFIQRANRYASVNTSDYQTRLCREYNVRNHVLNDYYRRCGNNWGNVGLVLEIAKVSGRSVRDVCDYYGRYNRYGWNRILVEIGMGPSSRHHKHFYDRIHYHSNCWHDYYESHCGHHVKPKCRYCCNAYCNGHHGCEQVSHHKGCKCKKCKKYYHRKKKYHDDDDDDDDWDD